MRWWIGVLFLLVAPGAAADPDELRLRRHGIRPTYESIRNYLRTLYPQPGTEQRMRELVRELGAGDPETRDRATRLLHREGAAAGAVLQRSLTHSDPEVRRRVRLLLEGAQGLLDSAPMYSAYIMIAKKHITGLAPEVLHSLALAKDGYVRVAGRKALAATATAADAGLLRKAAVQGEAQMRAAAARALGRLLREDARKDMRALLNDGEPLVRFAAALALAQIEDERSLDALVSLLGCSDAAIRHKSVFLLRELSGSRFGYAAYAGPAQREKSMAAWREWQKLPTKRVAWSVALEESEGFRERILIAIGAQPNSTIVEIDMKGTEHRRHLIPDFVQGIHGLRNGNVVVSLYSQRVVAEYDPRGREVWRSKPLRGFPISVQRLVNGNTLVALPQRSEVIEIAPDSRIVWSARPGAGCYFAQRMPSGITRASLYTSRQVVELDRGGVTRRRIAVGGQPYMSRQLENGNLLVCYASSGLVAEISPAGAEIRRWGGFRWPTSAYQLANGDLIVGDQRGVHRVSRSGRKQTIHRATGTIWISYY
ncbi:MAG: HEAT repeat domain-containing protein [Planctomycetota bacterium]|jgi:hypothetical protein